MGYKSIRNPNFEIPDYGVFVTKSGKIRKKRNSIDPATGAENLKRLLHIHCTIYEVAAFFEVSTDTVEKFCVEHLGAQFKELSERYQGQGKISLRRQLWRKAIEDNDLKAQIFLAKNTLGMADRVEVKADDGNYQFFLSYRLKESDAEKKDEEKKEESKTQAGE